MILGFEQALVRCRVERGTLERWITLSWVRPTRGDDGWHFSDADIARIELICDLHRELGIAEDAIEVILPLLDQVYALRRQMRALTDALGALPEETRREVLARLTPPER
jgi:chaperone modulatory protein CbpM